MRSTLFDSCSCFVDLRLRGRVEIDVMRPIDAERLVIARARAQHGVISSAQLGQAGVSAGWIRHRLARGWLRRLHRGVYLVGPVEAEQAWAMAAVLAIPGSVLSHYPAAALSGLRPPRDSPMHVTTGGNDARKRTGLQVHRAALHPRDITRRHGIPVTSPARTILDLAATEPSSETERALNEARILRLVSTLPSMSSPAVIRGTGERQH